ncbi:TlpA family protein disulfide reductase [Nitriliruptor alkaliphilus]|uniref:TlpA family protein disulfide reductase n=1 Tax=Nitriliruptor alkaliphilus TaxID=427918 RepID=UPI000695F424|nr:TlpA disulfide reductase family protein [Nitriliruptor alkaliphilus]
MRRVLIALIAVVLGLAACTGEGEIADFGPGVPDDEQPELPADGGLDVNEVAAPGEAPPADAQLEQVDWSEAAAWIRRENEAGRPVVINFFASFCEPCKRELPLLLDTAAAETDVAFLGVHTMEQRELGVQMVDEYDIAFPTFHDPSGDVVFEVGGRGLPHTVAFDTDGRLVSRVFGELTATNLDQLLSEVR